MRGLVKASGSTFYWSMRLLPSPRREAIYALYALCRELDNLADGPFTVPAKRLGLAGWSTEIDELFKGRPGHVLTVALAPAVAEYALERAEFNELIDGLRLDAGGTMQAPTLEILELYCRRVAGSVGLLMLPILGARTPAAAAFALLLGTAMQLTNILRDLGEDAAHGRLYLPREMLEAAGIAERAAGTVLGHANLERACESLAALAASRYAEAAACFPAEERVALRPALLMMAAYRRLLHRLRGGPWPNPSRPRIGLGLYAWLAARTYLTSRP